MGDLSLSCILYIDTSEVQKSLKFGDNFELKKGLGLVYRLHALSYRE